MLNKIIGVVIMVTLFVGFISIVSMGITKNSQSDSQQLNEYLANVNEWLK